MSYRTLLGIACTLVAFILYQALRQPVESVPVAIPPGKKFYILDNRSDTSLPLLRSPQEIKQLKRRFMATVSVRTLAAVTVVHDYQALFLVFAKTRTLATPPTIFFSLQPPYRDSKKKLTAAINAQTTLTGIERIALRHRLVMMRGADGLDDDADCQQLVDDWVYANDNAAGMGLVVTDETLAKLRFCVD